MKITFQADADLNEDIVTGVRRREPALDFQTAAEGGLKGVPDEQVLALAAREGRVLVSHDRRTMPRAFGNFILTETSPGLLIVSQQTSIVLAIEELLLIWTASEVEEWINRICFIPL
ncbi:MAG: hypothetical protein DMG10_25670 [Acidobacteria bacterium]|nr:MAG: hypothetical protein DMG10_25670 [Acidobacteriota bacterium]